VQPACEVARGNTTERPVGADSLGTSNKEVLLEGGCNRGDSGAEAAKPLSEKITEEQREGRTPAGGNVGGLNGVGLIGTEQPGVREEAQGAALQGTGGSVANIEAGLLPETSPEGAELERISVGGRSDLVAESSRQSKVGGLPANDDTGTAKECGEEGRDRKVADRVAAEVEGLSGSGGSGEGLEGIDMGEQRRIMHEIWMRKNLQKPSVAAGQRKVIKRNETQGTPKQPRLTDMFSKRS
jgi:hypothetical protein